MSRQLGPIAQFSYVVDDLDAAISHWAKIMEVGPFFVLDHVPYKRCLYLGQETPLDMSVALAYSGDTQIELVKQHNDAPSIFRTFQNAHGQGLQHIGIVSTDLDADLATLADRGVHPVQEGEARNGTRFAYVDSDLVPGAMLELFQLPDKIRAAFEYMRDAASQWDPQSDAARR